MTNDLEIITNDIKIITKKIYKYSDEYIKEKNKKYYEKHKESILLKHKTKNNSVKEKKYISVKTISP
jgi:hypothetical protein